MVYLIHRNHPTFLQTHLTERMRRSVAVTDSFPCSAVFLIYVRGTFILVVLPAGDCFVLLAVLSIREVRAAGVGTGALGFSWHRFTSLGHKKSPAGEGLPQGFRRFYFVHHNTIIRGDSQSLSFTLMMAATQESAVSCIR